LSFVLALRQLVRGALLLSAALALDVGGALAPAWAQGKLEAQYTVTLAGIPIGKGSWVVDIADTHYTAAASGTTTGLMRAFTRGQGTSAARGTFNAGRPQASVYAASISTSRKVDEIRLTINNGNVKESNVDPPLDQSPDRVPLTEAHQRDILDPMTASLLRAPATGDLMSPEVCQHTLPIFDGRLRYELQLAFKRMETVKADKGYAGPVVVCAVYFSPIAGFIPSRTAIKYITALRDMEVWLAPIAGTRVLVPFRAQGPTPIGRVVLEATQFVSVATPVRASANGSKTQ
jgi:hypothetical protein